MPWQRGAAEVPGSAMLVMALMGAFRVTSTRYRAYCHEFHLGALDGVLLYNLEQSPSRYIGVHWVVNELQGVAGCQLKSSPTLSIDSSIANSTLCSACS
ncbi:hypothetical protein Ae201684P_021356 [Aphanomyces euteiches]|nr:hypothetical protein Ae201684P_021356 [Aphanomyces euteiches]